jgi:hypothetical protein
MTINGDWDASTAVPVARSARTAVRTVSPSIRSCDTTITAWPRGERIMLRRCMPTCQDLTPAYANRAKDIAGRLVLIKSLSPCSSGWPIGIWPSARPLEPAAFILSSGSGVRVSPGALSCSSRNLAFLSPCPALQICRNFVHLYTVMGIS